MTARSGPAAATCLAALCSLLLETRPTAGQTAPLNQTQQLAFAGLRSSAAQGQFNAVKTDSAGNLYLLLDEKDGVRLLKTDNTASTVLAQTLLGTAGDIGLALALDPSGNLYVTGTTTSNTLTGSSNAAISTRTDASTNSFVAKFDSNLNLLFTTFTGGSRIAATALAATAAAVFVTGSLFTSTLPVTNNGIQQSPAPGSSQNGFVEKFSSDGTTLLYATYLTGANGNTAPAAIAADSADDAYIAGATTASGFPTIAALIPTMLSNPSGFLTKLTPAGDAITFSTFIPGSGITSLAVDSPGQTLLLSGNVALGQFPIATVAAPIAPIPYQSLIEIPLNGSSVPSSVLLAPGTQSSVAPTATSGSVWIDQSLTLPTPSLATFATLGTGLTLHITPQDTIDQSARFGGLPNANPTFASLPILLTSLAVDPSGSPIFAGSVQPTASAAFLASETVAFETYDLPLGNIAATSNLTAALPSTLRSSEPTAQTCSGSLCPGSAAYLSKLNPATSAPSLILSDDDAPFLVLRNLASAEATNLQLTATNAAVSTNCPTTLPAGAECDLLLTSTGTGTTAATLTVSATNAASQTVSIPAFAAPASNIAFFPKELDFGIQTSTSPTGLQTLTITNLGPTPQTFTSAALLAPKATTPFTEVSSDCSQAGAVTTKLLPPGSTCHITLGLTAPSTPSSDGLLQQSWQIGSRAVLLTGYSQAAALSVSASEVDFGTQFKAGLRLPRYLYLSNASTATLPHAAVTLPAAAPFTISDTCPSTLAPASVCALRLDYLPPTAPSKDSLTLTLDQGLTVLVTGQSLPQPGVGGSVVNPNLSVTPTSITFPNAVPVTAVSSDTHTISITNSGASPFTLTLALTADFTQQTSCPASLPAGQTCAVALNFAPSQPGVRQGLLAITAGSGFSPAYVSLTGTGSAILPANNGSFDFGSTPIGQPVTHFYKLSQAFSSLTASTTGPYSVTLIADLGYGPGNPASTAYTATATAACPSCYLAVRFLPTAAGAQPGTLTLTSIPNGTPYTLTLTGTGLRTTGLLLTPLTQTFGSVPVNSSSAPTLFTLTNLTTTAAPVTLTTPTLTGDFALNATPTGGNPCSGTLAYTASCLLNLDFAPTATGSRTGTLTFATSQGSVTAALTGYGTPDPGVALNPNALTFSNVPGAAATQQTLTLTNTGLLPLEVGNPSVTTTAFTASSACAALAPAAFGTVNVTFQPSTALASDTLTLPVTATTAGGNSTTTLYTVPLTGAYTAAAAGLQITPAQVAFGPTPIATESTPRQFTLANVTTRSYTVALTLPRQFALTNTLDPSCTTLAASATCTFSLAYVPLLNADATGSLFALATPSDTSAPLAAIAYLDGFGTPQAAALTITGPIYSGILSFGQVTSGQTGSVTLTLANRNPTGSPAITIHRITSPPPFLSTTTCGQALAPNQTCTVTLNYTPTNQVPTGTASPVSTTDTGLLTIESDASSSPDLVNLTGQAGPVAVASPSSTVPLATFTLSQNSLTFAATQVGNVSAPQAVTLTNTGTAILHVLSAFTTPDFTLQNTCATVLAGQTCTLIITAAPQTSGPHIAALQIASDSTTSLEFISLLAASTPSALTFAPTSLNFGPVPVASTSLLPVQVTNTSTSAVLFSTISANGDFAAGGDCPLPGNALPPSASCTVQVAFTPTQTGTRNGVLSLQTSASSLPLTVPLTGIGTQSQLTASPSPLAFGTVLLGSSATLTLTLTNAGSATLSNLALTLTGDFGVTVPCTFTVLTPGQSCPVQVAFTPTVPGPRTGTLTIKSTDPNSPLTIPLTGNAILGGSFTLTLQSASSVTVTAPTPAVYTLAVAPTGGYTGSVALTCAALNAGPFVLCNLQSSTLTLAGSPQTLIATLNTVTAINPAARPSPAAAVFLLPLLLLLRRSRRRTPALPLTFLTLTFFLIQGCGSGGNPNLRYTPPGTYRYQVTANSTSGTQITQSVTLTLNVH